MYTELKLMCDTFGHALKIIGDRNFVINGVNTINYNSITDQWMTNMPVNFNYRWEEDIYNLFVLDSKLSAAYNTFKEYMDTEYIISDVYITSSEYMGSTKCCEIKVEGRIVKITIHIHYDNKLPCYSYDYNDIMFIHADYLNTGLFKDIIDGFVEKIEDVMFLFHDYFSSFTEEQFKLERKIDLLLSDRS